MDVPYYPKLVEIRKTFEDHFLVFPFAQCYMASRAVHKLIGLKEIAGYAQGYLHTWNYDSRRKLYIDITSDDPNQKIYIASKEGSHLTQDNAMTGKVRKMADRKMFKENEGLLKIIQEMARE